MFPPLSGDTLAPPDWGGVGGADPGEALSLPHSEGEVIQILMPQGEKQTLGGDVTH